MPHEEVLHALDLLRVEVDRLVASTALLFDHPVVLQRTRCNDRVFLTAIAQFLLFKKLLPSFSEALQFEVALFYPLAVLLLLLHVSQ